jgi:alkanesulfonate monooxygenase SsuD/methylene tetrahydromethanopterin reductase-like flavin-dependent oxidoreductase (luciferase family)
VVFVSPTEAHEAWTIATAAAMLTKNIKLGTVSDPHRMHPAVFAQRLASIDHISKGRVTLLSV